MVRSTFYESDSLAEGVVISNLQDFFLRGL